LQHKHLVPLDAISQCNALESLTSLLICTLASTSELEGSQAHLHKPPRLKDAQQPAQGRPMLGYIAPKEIEPLYPFTGLTARRPDTLQGAPDASGHPPNAMCISHLKLSVGAQWLTRARSLTIDRTLLFN